MKLSHAVLFLLASGILSAGQSTDSGILDTFVLKQQTQSGYTVTLELEKDFNAPVDNTGWLNKPIVINGESSGVVVTSLYKPSLSTQTHYSFTVANVKAVHEAVENNEAPTHLPLIHSKTNHTTSFTGLKDVTFSNNTCSSKNSITWIGAIRLDQGASLSISDNTGKVTFSNNKLTDAGNSSMGAMNGGVIYAAKNFDSVKLENNAGGVSIIGNGIEKTQTSGVCYGGFMCISTSGSKPQPDNNISICGNSSVDISNNYAIREATTGSGNVYGGVFNIITDNGVSRSLDISRNTSTVSISENIAKATTGSNGALGGFLRASYYGLKIDENAGKVTLSRNAVEATGTTLDWNGRIKGGEVKGGAAVVTYAGISLCGNQNGIEISGNHGYSAAGNAAGGAFYNDRSINISQNKGEVVFTGNYVQTDANADTANDIPARGGAIYFDGGGVEGRRVTLNNNDKLSFTNNYAASAQLDSTVVEGGAIYIDRGALEIAGNGDVEFSGNYTRKGDRFVLNAIHQGYSTSTSPSTKQEIILAAKTGHSIAFYDSFTATNCSELQLNSSYLDADGNKTAATGTIVFSGSRTEELLKAAKVAAAAKEGTVLNNPSVNPDELTESRTSNIDAKIKLHNGTLRVEDGAVLQSQGIDVQPGATVQVANGARMAFANEINLSDNLHQAGTFSNILIENGNITGNGEGAALSDLWIEGYKETHNISNVTMSNVHFSAVLTTLNLTNVSFDNASYFSVGETGTIVLENASVRFTLDDLAPGSGVFTADLSNLFHCTTKGQLELDIDTQKLASLGYSGISVQFSEEVTPSDDFSIIIDEVEYSYDGTTDQNGAPNINITLVPEPATTTLSLLALTALAARRRRH